MKDIVELGLKSAELFVMVRVIFGKSSTSPLRMYFERMKWLELFRKFKLPKVQRDIMVCVIRLGR
jgi:purine-cytosine permease-like protein